ncbi:hypothetical protein AB6I73_003906 [Citrobacter amalonaticus]
MCDKCKKTNAKVESVIKKVGAAELVEIMGLVVGHEDDTSPIDRIFSVLKFSSMIDEPIEIVMLARHFGEAYLAEKNRADKLQETLNMATEPKCSPVMSQTEESITNKEREIAGLKSSLAMLMAAFRIMSAQVGYKMPDLNSEDPMAVKKLLGEMADQLTATIDRLEDMMRELTHRHDLTKQPHKMQQTHH